MKIWQPGVLTHIAFLLGCIVSPASAADLARFDFAAPANGNQVTNLGVGSAGILLNGATVGDGVLHVDGLGQGLDIPLGVLSPFGGDADWRVAFDFASVDEGGGPLFSSDSSDCSDGCNDDEQAGSINIFLTGEGEVIADAWFIGAMGGGAGLNDGETHSVELYYTAEESLWELSIDGELADDAVWEYSRDASRDRTRIGDQSNPDFGFEDIDPGMDGIVATFDNVVIEAAAPPPVLVTVNRETGAISMASIIEDEFNFNSVSILSDSGSLASDKWISIAGNYDAAGDGSVDGNHNWTVVTATGEELSENEAAGDGGQLTPGQVVALGEGVWLASPLEDIRVELFDTVAQDTVRGAVAYTGAELLFGDLNLDGDLNGLDWNLFVEGFGQDLEELTGRDAYFLADLNGDGIHNADDFIEFVEAYDNANGGGAFAASVPEPSGLALLGLGALGLLARRRRRRSWWRRGLSKAPVGVRAFACFRSLKAVLQRMSARPLLLATLTALLFVVSDSANAELLVEYTFQNGTTDTSGNNRHGDLDTGIFGDGDPKVTGGQLSLTGKVGESMIIPLEAANPFDGSSDFTIDMSFTAFAHEDGAGHLLISSADFDTPDEGDNHSMALFIEPEGDIVYDNFFVGEVRVSPPDFVINEAGQQQHDLRVTYTAPAEAGEPGTLFIRVDGAWLGSGEIAPDVPDIMNHEVRLGSSLNEEFPFECEEECFVRDFLGELDDVRIYNESFAPTQLTAEVDRATGDVKLVGGEFVRNVKYYELSSEAGALNSAAWASGNLDAQNLDAAGEASGETWDTLTGDSNRLVEAFLLGSTVFDDGKVVTLPGTWAGGAEDLVLRIVTTDQEVLGIDVMYVGQGNGNMGMSLDCNGDGLVNATDFDCSNTAGTTADLIAELGLIEGDLDGDGSVSFADFLLLSANFSRSAPYSGGDIDGDGTVAFPDFLVLSANFGQSAGTALAAVPEPNGILVLILGVSLSSIRLRRRS